MKTLNKNSETKKSKFKNALLRSGAVVISFVLISFTVSAQDFWKQLLTESGLSQFAMIMVGETSAEIDYAATPSNSEMDYYNFEVESDQPLEVEEWMGNENYFGNSLFSITEDVDEPLEVEAWMKETKYFDTNIKVEKDKKLKLEKWMVSGKYWVM